MILLSLCENAPENSKTCEDAPEASSLETASPKVEPLPEALHGDSARAWGQGHLDRRR